MVDAAPLVAAIEVKAAETGTPVAALLGSAEAKRAFYRARTQLRKTPGTARISGFDAVEAAAAAGLDARDLYGEAVLPAPVGDGQVDYHLDATERPLVWIGNGLTEFGITPGSTLTPEQFPWARRLMRGEDPRAGRTLVEPKLAVAPAAKLPAAPLVRAVRRTAAERGVQPAELLDSRRKKAAFGRMERQLTRHGESHRVPVSVLLNLAEGAGVDAVALYGEEALEKALAAEEGGRLDARPLLHAVARKADETNRRPEELFTAASLKRRFLQTAAEGERRLRDLPMAAREAVALAKAAGLDPEQIWDTEEIKAALREGRVEVGNRGADLTLDLPKSKSVFLAYAPDELAREVEAVYTGAGREAVEALERWTAYAMRGRHGDGRSAETIPTSGFCGWMMVHRAARPVGGAPYGDPHFHLHFTLANMVKGTDGRCGAKDSGKDYMNRTEACLKNIGSATLIFLDSDPELPSLGTATFDLQQQMKLYTKKGDSGSDLGEFDQQLVVIPTHIDEALEGVNLNWYATNNCDACSTSPIKWRDINQNETTAHWTPDQANPFGERWGTIQTAWSGTGKEIIDLGWSIRATVDASATVSATADFGTSGDTRVRELAPRCDNILKGVAPGCAFPYFKPIYTVDTNLYPAAGAYYWLMQEKMTSHPGSKKWDSLLHRLGPDTTVKRPSDGQPWTTNDSRDKICPSSWSPHPADASLGALSCDEYAMASTHESGGFPGGPNQVGSGNDCAQLTADKMGTGTSFGLLADTRVATAGPSWEKCGRASIPTAQNTGACKNLNPAPWRLLDDDGFFVRTPGFEHCANANTTCAWKKIG
ncbi:hypothetical protein EF917_04270 [Streptomyces sp. WAC00469]|nr:hypothetical protein EF917_04270 [Streptomyces sp. WAC00469]